MIDAWGKFAEVITKVVFAIVVIVLSFFSGRWYEKTKQLEIDKELSKEELRVSQEAQKNISYCETHCNCKL